MGRDKKNPKPLDTAAFNTLVKTASEVIRRHEQALYARLHKEVHITVGEDRLKVTLDIVPDDDEPHAFLAAVDVVGNELARVRVAAHYKLSVEGAEAWAAGGFERPR
jgi:DsbC/DsbD-like thiol-disulfide interchange protein